MSDLETVVLTCLMIAGIGAWNWWWSARWEEAVEREEAGLGPGPGGPWG